MTLFPHFSMQSAPPVNSARLLLTKLRGGDYAHAGDQEAINLVIKHVLQLSPDSQRGNCLDVGSGFGGTADAIYQMGFHHIWGIDRDEASVCYAQEKYPHIPFFHLEASQIPTLFDPSFFSFIYLFNVLYAIEDKPLILKKLAAVAKPGAILALFDYTIAEGSLDLKDLAGKPMYPIVLHQLQHDLKESGWEVLEIIDLSQHYLRWYRALIDKLSQHHLSLLEEFSAKEIAQVTTTFSTIIHWLDSSLLGGVVIYCRRQPCSNFKL